MDEPGFYIIKNGVLTGYVGAAQHAFIPAGVKHIAPYVFARHDHLINVTFPEGLESIGEGAFSGCVRLREIRLGPDTAVGPGAFKGCPGIPEIIRESRSKP